MARKQLTPSSFLKSSSSSLSSLPHASPLFLPTCSDIPSRAYKPKVKTRYSPSPPSPREVPSTLYSEELVKEYSDPCGEKWFPSVEQVGEIMKHDDYYKVIPEVFFFFFFFLFFFFFFLFFSFLFFSFLFFSFFFFFFFFFFFSFFLLSFCPFILLSFSPFLLFSFSPYLFSTNKFP